MTQSIRVHSAKEYAEAVGPHLAHGTERADDIPKRLLGVACTSCDKRFQISIPEFKGTGDLDAYQAAIEPFKGAEGKTSEA